MKVVVDFIKSMSQNVQSKKIGKKTQHRWAKFRAWSSTSTLPATATSRAWNLLSMKDPPSFAKEKQQEFGTHRMGSKVHSTIAHSNLPLSAWSRYQQIVLQHHQVNLRLQCHDLYSDVNYLQSVVVIYIILHASQTLQSCLTLRTLWGGNCIKFLAVFPDSWVILFIISLHQFLLPLVYRLIVVEWIIYELDLQGPRKLGKSPSIMEV